MKTIIAFLCLASAAPAQYYVDDCGPSGCGIGIGANIGSFGIGIGAGFTEPEPRINPVHDYAAVVRVTDGNGYFSGVVIDPCGVVLTAKHCLRGKPLKVEVAGTIYQAEIAFTSPDSDGPAVLTIDAHDLKFCKLADSIGQGTPCYSAGFPHGETRAFIGRGRLCGGGWFFQRNGEVSNSQEGVPGAWRGNRTNFRSLQGMSGGPLFNLKGEVIGLLSASGPCDSIFISFAATKAAAEKVGGEPSQPTPIKPEADTPALPPPVEKPAEKPNSDLDVRLDRLEALLLTVQAKPGAKGDKGEPGATGPRGLPGKDADPARLNSMTALLSELVAEVTVLKQRPDSGGSDLRVDALEAELARLKATKIPVQILTQDGQIFDHAEYTLGKPIKLKLAPVGQK